MSEDRQVLAIEAEYLRGELSFADYRKDLERHFRSATKPPSPKSWRQRFADARRDGDEQELDR